VVSGRLADVHLAAGDEKTARQLWRTALDILDELDHPAAEGIRTKLRS
jgi:hypothetical protein